MLCIGKTLVRKQPFAFITSVEYEVLGKNIFLILSRLLVCCSVYHFSSSNYGRSYYLDENISGSTKNQTYTGKWVTPVITICPEPAVMEEDLSTEDIKCFSSILLVGCQFTSCKFFLILHSHISVTKSSYLFLSFLLLLICCSF